MEFHQTNHWLSRGEEGKKQRREKRRQDTVSAMEKDRSKEMRDWKRIKYKKGQSVLINARLEKFTS